MKKLAYSLAFLCLIGPATAADLPPPQAKKVPPPAKVQKASTASPNKVVLTQGGETLTITCSPASCSAVKTEKGKVYIQAFGKANLQSLVRDAQAYGWK